MLTISQYRENIKALLKKSAEIDAKAQAENRDLSEAEISLKNEIMDEVESLQKTVMTMERQERIQAAMSGPANAPLSRPAPIQVPPLPALPAHLVGVVRHLPRPHARVKGLPRRRLVGALHVQHSAQLGPQQLRGRAHRQGAGS